MRDCISNNTRIRILGLINSAVDDMEGRKSVIEHMTEFAEHDKEKGLIWKKETVERMSKDMEMLEVAIREIQNIRGC